MTESTDSTEPPDAPEAPETPQPPVLTRVERTRLRQEEAQKAQAEKAEARKRGRRRSTGHARGRRRLPRWLTVIGWIVIVPLGVVAIMRFVAWDDIKVFAVLNTVSVFLYLPAWIVAVVAVIGRRYLLTAGALLVMVAQLFIVLPEFTAAEPAPAWAADAPSISLLDANVYYLNGTRMIGYASEIKQYQPQLLTMQESTPFDVKQLEQSGALSNLPYRFEVSLFNPKAFLVASKYRLSGSRVVYFDGLPLMVQTTVHLPSGPLPLWVVHTAAPVTDSFQEWKGALNLVATLIKRRGTHGLLVVGDFNATWGSRGFRGILDTGLIDGAAARGRALDMTWSQTKHPLPPFVRIDHILTGPGVAVTSIRTEAGVGSDHRDLFATVAVRRPSG